MHFYQWTWLPSLDDDTELVTADYNTIVLALYNNINEMQIMFAACFPIKHYPHWSPNHYLPYRLLVQLKKNYYTKF